MLAFRLCVLMSVVSLTSLDAAPITYPSTRTVNQVDAYHGISVRDPYRWLEEVDSGETAAWVNAQRAVTESFLRTIPERDTIRARLDALTNIPRSGIPVKQGGRYFSSHNTGLQNQPTLRMRTTLDAAPTVVLDPNQLASDGTVALTAYAASPDGRWLAYALRLGLERVSHQGSHHRGRHRRHPALGEVLPHELDAR